jgi:hypothetical protein
VGYRDELEALRAKNAELEEELAATRREIERDRRTLRQDEPHWFLGGPSRLTREIELDGELDEEGLELLVDELRREIGEVGRTEQLGQTLTWASNAQSGRLVEVSCVRRKGRTRITIRENLKQLAGGLFGGGLGGAGGGGMGFVVPLAMRTPALVPFFIIGWFVLVYAVVRTVYARLAMKRGQKLDALTLRLGRELRRELRSATAEERRAAVRVQTDDDEHGAELEALAEDERAERDVGTRRR